MNIYKTAESTVGRETNHQIGGQPTEGRWLLNRAHFKARNISSKSIIFAYSDLALDLMTSSGSGTTPGPFCVPYPAFSFETGPDLLVFFGWCLMSLDVGWHVRDKLRPVCEQGSIVLYVHGNQKARQDGQPRTATSTLTQLLNYVTGPPPSWTFLRMRGPLSEEKPTTRLGDNQLKEDVSTVEGMIQNLLPLD